MLSEVMRHRETGNWDTDNIIAVDEKPFNHHFNDSGTGIDRGCFER